MKTCDGCGVVFFSGGVSLLVNVRSQRINTTRAWLFHDEACRDEWYAKPDAGVPLLEVRDTLPTTPCHGCVATPGREACVCKAPAPCLACGGARHVACRSCSGRAWVEDMSQSHFAYVNQSDPRSDGNTLVRVVSLCAGVPQEKPLEETRVATPKEAAAWWLT